MMTNLKKILSKSETHVDPKHGMRIPLSRIIFLHFSSARSEEIFTNQKKKKKNLIVFSLKEILTKYNSYNTWRFIFYKFCSKLALILLMCDRYRLFYSFEIISSRRKAKRDTAFVFSDLLSASIADYTLHPRVGVIMLSLPSRNLHALCPRRLGAKWTASCAVGARNHDKVYLQ